MLQAHVADGAHGQCFCKAGVVDVKECVGAKMLGHANGALPLPTAFDDVDMLGADANSRGVVLGGLGSFDQVHPG